MYENKTNNDFFLIFFSVHGYIFETKSCGGFMVLPVHTLDMDYLAVTNWGGNNDKSSEIAAVAIHDNTTVRFTFQPQRGVKVNYNNASYLGGQTLQV